MRRLFHIKSALSMLAVLAAVQVCYAQQTNPADSAAAGRTGNQRKDYDLRMPVEMADTIPGDFFLLSEQLGLNRYTEQLINRFQQIPDKLILEVLAQADSQVAYRRSNAYIVAYAVGLLCQEDSLWASFFSDIDIQFREPNILRVNFRDDQKWKSYVLNDLFYSTFLQELLIGMGNIGITNSRDGKQWLDGWPTEMRWKYREYQFEYLPENVGIRVIDLRRSTDTSAAQAGDAIRITPTNPILPMGADTVEPPYRIPRP